ncbi:hypothetical protein L9F63_028312, partial [Diploptera punctata]
TRLYEVVIHHQLRTALTTGHPSSCFFLPALNNQPTRFALNRYHCGLHIGPNSKSSSLPRGETAVTASLINTNGTHGWNKAKKSMYDARDEIAQSSNVLYRTLQSLSLLLGLTPSLNTFVDIFTSFSTQDSPI